MNLCKKMLWGGLGWALGGPIGAIIGYSFASMSGQSTTKYSGGYQSRGYPNTQPGDFIISLLVLFGAVMKADKRMLKSELDFVKDFLSKQFSHAQVQDFMTLFKDIIKQEYPLRDVCKQIVRSMDHPSRLELIHILFGLSKADGSVDKDEVKVIQNIARYLNINQNDFNSIEAMFFRNTFSGVDIMMSFVLEAAKMSGSLEKFSNLEEILKRYQERDAYQKAIEIGGEYSLGK